MAGDWIKTECVTPDKPEIFRMAEILGIPAEHVLGCLIRVWIWADQQSISGNALSVTSVTLDTIARHAGITQAMCEVGWARKLSTGYSLTNFERHNGKTAKNRALTSQRQAKFRNAQVTRQPLPEKRREYNPQTPTSAHAPAPPIPAAHSTDKAREALEESRQAAQQAVPMPDQIREQLAKALKPQNPQTVENPDT